MLRITSLIFALLVSWSACAQVPLTGAGKGTPGGTTFSLVFQSVAGSSNTSTATVDYGTMSFASATRLTLGIAAFGGTTPTVTGATIGGNALAHVSGTFINDGGDMVDIWESTGTIAGPSGDVQVTYGSALGFNSAVAVYALTTTTPAASYGSGVNPGNAVSPTTLVGVTVPSGGRGIVVVFGSSKVFSAWTNAATDSLFNCGGNTCAFGHTTSTGTFNVSYAWTTGLDQIPMAVAAWGP